MYSFFSKEDLKKESVKLGTSTCQPFQLKEDPMRFFVFWSWKSKESSGMRDAIEKSAKDIN